MNKHYEQTLAATKLRRHRHRSVATARSAEPSGRLFAPNGSANVIHPAAVPV
jgi:hypothetical protein